MTTALVLVDIQNDYFPGGKMELEGSVHAGHKAGKILAYFRENGLPRIHVQHVSLNPDAPFFVAGTPGVEIHDSVKPVEGEVVFQKHFPNSFRNTPLLDHLKRKLYRQPCHKRHDDQHVRRCHRESSIRLWVQVNCLERRLRKQKSILSRYRNSGATRARCVSCLAESDICKNPYA